MNPLSIAFLCDEYPPSAHGGIGTFVQTVGRALAARGHKVRVAGSYPESAEGADVEMDEGVEVHRLRWKPKQGIGAGLRNFVGIRRQIFSLVAQWARAGAIEIIEIPDAYGWAAWWPKLPVPVIARVHGSSTYFKEELGQGAGKMRNLYYWTERLSMRRMDAWCAVSQYAAEKTQRLFGLASPGTISYVPVTVPGPVRPEERIRNRVVYTGTLTFKKGIVSLVKAWPGVIERCPEAELHVFGKDLNHRRQPMSAFALSQIAERARASIHFHGHTPRAQISGELAKARAAVFPSYAEAFAFAPIEAMATGCPTVYSTRCSGPELMETGRDGLLIDPDRPEQITTAIISLLTDDELARRLGDTGRTRVIEHFTMGRLLPSIEQFYRDTIERFHSAGMKQPATLIQTAGGRR